MKYSYLFIILFLSFELNAQQQKLPFKIDPEYVTLFYDEDFKWYKWDKAPEDLKKAARFIHNYTDVQTSKEVTMFDQIQEHLESECKVQIAAVDLDGDGVCGLAIFSEGSSCCGTLGCMFALYENGGLKTVELGTDNFVLPARNGVEASTGHFFPLIRKTEIPGDKKKITELFTYRKPNKTVPNTQVSKKQTPLSPAAKIIFRDIPTLLSNEEKNFFAEDIRVEDAEYITLLLVVDSTEEYMPRVEVFISPTDLNKDGIEEIFIQQNSDYFGREESDLQLYIKDKSGEYIFQDMSSAHWHTRATGFGGYPDLIGDDRAHIGGGWDQTKPVTKFDTYRWNGKAYKLYKKAQPHLSSDKSIEVISWAYVISLPVIAEDIVEEQSMARGNEGSTEILEKKPESIAAKGTKTETSSLTPMAALLFANVKSRLSDAEKNEVVAKAGITPADTLEKTKKGKPKKVFTVYPTDINSDGTEDIFICVTTSLLGIPQNNYYFFAKDGYGNYQPAPGKIGNGVRVLMNGKSGYPDLIAGAPGLHREIWSWNGGTYFLVQRISGNTPIPYQTMDIDKASLGYAGTLNNPARNAVLNVFDGEWYSPEYKYALRINGNTGISTPYDFGNYIAGNIILVIKSFDGTFYHASQKYVDGSWRNVTLKLKNKNEIIIRGSVEWIMTRKSNGAGLGDKKNELISLAQISKIDIYDAIKLLTPDSSEKTQMRNWNTLPKSNSAFQWEQFDCGVRTTGCYQSGQVELLPSEHFEGSEEGINCSLSLDGTKEGYKSFHIETGWNVQYAGDMKNPFKLLFDKKAYKATFYKKCDKPSALLPYSYVIYKFEIPGKKPIWLKFGTWTDMKENTRTYFEGYLSLKSVDTCN